MSRVCQGCGTALPPKTWQGRDRKWCSDRCRKQTLYARNCVDCGAWLNGSDGCGPNAPMRCPSCNGRYVGAQRKVWTRDAIIAAIQEWAAEHDGEHPTVLAWGPDVARNLGSKAHPDYLAEPNRWPHINTVMREFAEGGQYRQGWRNAVIAAGFTPRERGHTLAQLRARALA